MNDLIMRVLEESVDVKQRTVQHHMDTIVRTAERLTACLVAGHKILIFGNGGSAADAQHLAAEFVNRFQMERPPLAALALTTDTSVLTSIANDYHFDDVFAKQVKALGAADDVAWGISTSGNSPNVVKAIDTANTMGMTTVVFSGRGGQLASMADYPLTVDSDITARIQESHNLIGHMLCDLVERMLFPPTAAEGHPSS